MLLRPPSSENSCIDRRTLNELLNGWTGSTAARGPSTRERVTITTDAPWRIIRKRARRGERDRRRKHADRRSLVAGRRPENVQRRFDREINPSNVIGRSQACHKLGDLRARVSHTSDSCFCFCRENVSRIRRKRLFRGRRNHREVSTNNTTRAIHSTGIDHQSSSASNVPFVGSSLANMQEIERDLREFRRD